MLRLLHHLPFLVLSTLLSIAELTSMPGVPTCGTVKQGLRNHHISPMICAASFSIHPGLSHNGLIRVVFSKQKSISGASQDEQVGLPSNDEQLSCPGPQDS